MTTNDRISTHNRQGMYKGTMGDLFRVNNNLPLDNHSKERFIATKVPVRKNKDYRARFRSFSFGFPVYFYK